MYYRLSFLIFLFLIFQSCGTETESIVTYNLTTSVKGEGTVTPSSGEFEQGEVVTITSSPSEGWSFQNWSSDGSGSSISLSITMDSDKNVIGNFVKREYPLNITIDGEGTVEENIVQSKSTDYLHGTVVELTPIPSDGWRFVEWSGDLSGSETPQTITVDSEKNVTVTFEKKDYPLNITIDGEGTVEENIVQSKSTDYPHGTVVELTSKPTDGWVFYQWSDDLDGGENPQTIEIDNDKNITSTFKSIDELLTIEIIGDGIVDIQQESFEKSPSRRMVTLTPTPSDGSRFVEWGGDLSGNENPKQVTVDGEKNITVKFSPIVFLGENGVTIMCPDGQVGDIGIVDGVEYEVVDRPLLEQRRNDGKDLTNVCTSLVTDLSGIFSSGDIDRNIFRFNQPIENWDVSNVINMSKMFKNSTFNQPIGIWNVSNVTNMSEMFYNSSFNQPIKDWNVGSVINMYRLFFSTPFNQPIGSWDVSNVKDMYGMFNGTPFNKPIGGWNVSNVKDMGYMFYGTIFNQPIGSWDVSSVTNMRGMFGVSQFDQPIENWDVSNVNDMLVMFRNSIFNQPIGKWDLRSVTILGRMFEDSQFNQPIGDWNVSNVITMERLFWNSQFNQPIEKWNVSNVDRMNGMFYGSQFDQDIGSWDVGNVTTMWGMFNSSLFNQPIGDWNVSLVSNMEHMFKDSEFNQPLENWDVSRVESMSEIFMNSNFNQTIITWCVFRINSEPSNFSTNSPLTEDNKPVWGTCPD